MTIQNLEDALINELRDMLHAEKQLLKALPKMAKATEDEELAEAFQTHLEQTEGQIERLEECFEIMGKSPRAKVCEGMKGIVKEGEEMMSEIDAGPTCDAVLIASAQKVEHYEIASYGTMVTWAEQLGFNDIAELLSESLNEEKETDELLTQIAGKLNPESVEA